MNRDGKWDELTFAKTSGIVNKTGKKNWPIADRHVPGNVPANNSGTHFGSSFSPLKGRVLFGSSSVVLAEYEQYAPYSSCYRIIIRLDGVVSASFVI